MPLAAAASWKNASDLGLGRPQRLGTFGAEPVAERLVIDGNVITTAGGLGRYRHGGDPRGRIVGDDAARALRLVVEYDPQPPYASG
jgi:hypothetical protein